MAASGDGCRWGAETAEREKGTNGIGWQQWIAARFVDTREEYSELALLRSPLSVPPFCSERVPTYVTARSPSDSSNDTN